MTIPKLRLLLIAIVSLFLSLPLRASAAGERRFSSPEDAARTLIAAVRAKDKDALNLIFGPALADLRSGDEVQDAADLKSFGDKLAYRAEVSLESDTNGILEAGPDAWPFPVPLIKEDGQWFFDTAAGKEEILNRRIGRNELNTIDACHAYVDAQREYAAADHNNDDIFEYAKKIRSDPGTKNGLYWESKSGESLSPLGPLFAAARAEGYSPKNGSRSGQPSPYHGYYFKILTRQGAHAPGGKYDYVINGHLVGGFALVAWPVAWGNSGVMTFIVNQRGKVFQKDLGPNTSSLADAVTEFDPDKTWTATQE